MSQVTAGGGDTTGPGVTMVGHAAATVGGVDMTGLGATVVGHPAALWLQKWRTQGGDCGTGAAAAGPSAPALISAAVVARNASSRANRGELAEDASVREDSVDPGRGACPPRPSRACPVRHPCRPGR